ncbi:hypothetical protein Peur_069705 [Populus x canadensis]|uniref:Neprosin PEP catalytic domain-containing protein n=2 Tax=Populus TaxID=3689 RepID=A0A8T2WZV5_POPDE|nr:unknown [Populus trichocarpa x Populus deltoides]KAH8486905.1 hypothetical protein H0E87_025779 [Populus deltoides]
MKLDSFPWTKLKNFEPFCILHTTRQPQCIQTVVVSAIKTTTIQRQQRHRHSKKMAASTSLSTHPMIPIFVAFLLVFASSVSPVLSSPALVSDSGSRLLANQTFRPSKEVLRLRRANAYLKKINKPAVKTIQSPDGDVIHCVLSHLQPAFDHPELKGKKPLDPPERPRSNETRETVAESYQLWTDSGESCPEGTVPIRRTTVKDVLRASSVNRFGRKLRRHVRRDSTGSGHEHAVVFVNGDQYFGAKASINVWSPQVTSEYEFSLSQIWVISGSFGNDLNTIEAGWQVSPDLYGDGYPRFFTYWTTDAYQATGCYNLLCSGFVQTNNKIAIGAAISPRSSYNGRQFDIGLTVWKDPKHGNWWLEYGSGLLVGYWPAFLFSHLRSHASMVQFGGEIVNSRSAGYHTSTQMGSGHFADEGFGKASYFRNLQVVDWDNNLLPLTNLHLLADHPNCYNIRQGRNNVWGTYFYYGGPGRNVRCP